MALDVAHFGHDRPGRPPVVVGLGTCNALGTTPHQTWAFRRAEVTAFVGSPFRLPSGNALTFARVRQLDPLSIGGERLVSLAHRALDPVGELLARVPTRARLGIVLCLPERADPARGEERGRHLRRRLETTVIGPFVERGHDVLARVVARGHASFGYAAVEAGRMLEERRLDVALLIGVDGWYDPFLLETLFEQKRVLDSEWREAFVPGEAATAVLLARPDVARELGFEALAALDSAATNEEVATAFDDVPSTGHGLSRPAVAIAKRLAKEGRGVDWWLCDVTGESFRVHELQLAWPRASHLVMTPEASLELLPTHLGDIGAATMPTAAAIGIEGLRRRDPPGSVVLVSGSSAGGDRGVVAFTVCGAS
ncbi:MAG TPA: hypothetical protein RMH99_29345 [Sandaracinaceae bacterium LLY-WYZ-13_1]|nr:hypothetical protein [Sandaracinaceae bacterium LLY-WYZ-13_1]